LVSENQYRKGLEDAKKGITISSKPSVVIKPQIKHRQYNSIEELDDDE
jgi:hypothetical protein